MLQRTSGWFATGVSDLDLPVGMADWCVRELGARPVAVVHRSDQMSSVLGLRLDDGRKVAVKDRLDVPAGRAASCVAMQLHAAQSGLPVARPLTPARTVTDISTDSTDSAPIARHAEAWRPGGQMSRDAGPSGAARCATAFARLMEVLVDLDASRPIVRPPWVDWDHDGPGVYPPVRHLDERDQSKIPTVLMKAARQAKQLLRTSRLPVVVGHADFEAQNLRWHGEELWCIHDFDSLGTGPEAAFVGAAAGAFASQETPTLAPLASSQAFLEHYQKVRRRRFSAAEVQVAWAAGLWPAIWNARAEALYGNPPATTTPLLEQLAERLRLAGLES